MDRQALKKYCMLFALLLLAPWVIAQEEEAEAAEDAAVEEQAAEASEPVKTGPAPPIYIAAKMGRLQQLRRLLEEGADINATNNNGRTALMGATSYRNRGIVKELLVEGANVDAADSRGRTALMMAVINNDADIVALLIGAGADLTLQDKDQKTAATFSEKIKNKKLVKLLEE